MRLLTLLVACCCLVIACSNGRITKQVKDPSGVDWLEDALYDASRFWENHDVDIMVGDEGMDVGTKDLDEGVFGVCTFSGIYLDPEIPQSPWPEQLARCVMAHEIGHSFGMSHTEEGEHLMSPVLYLPAGTGCFWSKEDQEELDQLRE